MFIHNPHQRMGHMSGRMMSSQANMDLSILNINQRVLSLAAGRLNDAINRDSLVVGTPTNLLAYDVENNSDLFYKDVPDGANCVQIGPCQKYSNFFLCCIQFSLKFVFE